MGVLVRVCGNVRNREIRTIPAFARFSSVRGSVRTVRKNAFPLARLHAGCYLHARKAL